MVKLFAVLVGTFIAVTVNAQPDLLWSRTYDDGRDFNSVIQTADGGFALVGHTNDRAFWLVRTDEEGEELWSQTFSDEPVDYCHSGIQTADGGFALAGSIKPDEGIVDALLVKMDEEGELLWSHIYGDGGWDEFQSVIQTEGGGFALAGRSRSVGWLVVTDEEGEEIWSRSYVGEGRSRSGRFYSAIQTADGGYALAGNTWSGDGSPVLWLIRTDDEGEELWRRTYGGDSPEYCYSGIQTADGGFALAGRNGGFLLVRTDDEGEELWSQTYRGEGEDKCYSVIQTPDGGFAMAGKSGFSYNDRADFWLVRTDKDGEELWSQTYGGEESDICNAVIQSNDGGFALVGTTNSFGEGYDSNAWLVKTEPDPVSAPHIVDPALPIELILMPPYPNPFNATTQIRFGLPNRSTVRINVLDLYGRTVATLADRTYKAGFHSITWDATAFPTGLYLVRLEAGDVARAVKMTLIR